MALGYSTDGIIELMKTPPQKRTVDWLKDALQQAVMLELATLPPYLCGWWSLRGDTPSGVDAVAALKIVIFDEMSHLGHVCNLLTTIGGQPVLADTRVIAPYPCPLPGGVRPKLNPDLQVFLSGFSPESVQMYSEIESPEKPLATMAAKEETFQSIGLFYTAIRDAFEQHQDKITGRRQVVRTMDHHGKGNTLFPIRTFQDAESAITIIQEQGEGTSQTPDNPFPGFEGELSHYYVFRQIFRGKKLVKVQENPPKWEFAGDPIPFPNARPMAKVPQGGWANSPDTVPDATTQAQLDLSNQAFSAMLRALEQAWQQDDPAQADSFMGEAIGQMFQLKGPALALMGMELPHDPSMVYGPELRYVPAKP